MDREHIVAVFRERLLALIERTGKSRSAFAVRVGIDRSTLSQLLSSDNNRLPRAEVVIAIADAGQVTCDWLLGRTQDEQRGPELVHAGVQVENDAASPMDARLAQWHREATGYKIRYIPTTLPDLLKTRKVIEYEGVKPAENGASDTSLEQASEQLRYSRHPETEMEACCAFQTLELFARGQGVWQHLAPAHRREQIERMIALTEELYPTFRWSLYDGLGHFSVPVTVFGARRAVVYVGNLYFVFNTTDPIGVLMSRFDELVKSAVIEPTSVQDFLHTQLKHIGS
jgi:transcriptional regulator with XRE-family HTH domain